MRYERVFIVGDINIHICGPKRPLVKNLLDFFCSQSVNGPTDGRMDLVLWSVRLSFGNWRSHFSDHWPVLFDFVLCMLSRRRRVFNLISLLILIMQICSPPWCLPTLRNFLGILIL